MRLFEAIVEANHRAVAGDANAGLHPDEYAAELPIVALTCVDPRLNPLFPNVLGLPGDEFVWLRNAGNIVTGPLSSTMRSLALACAVKGGKEVAIIGHTDCQVGKLTTARLLDSLKALGVDRSRLPDNIGDYFGLFSSEQQNVIKACDIVRHSPLIGAQIPVHGFIVDTENGKLEWIVNGYENWGAPAAGPLETAPAAGGKVGALSPLADFQIGEMKFPEAKIGETVTQGQDWLARQMEKLEVKPPAAPPPAAPQPPSPPAVPPRIPLPPPMRPRLRMRRGGR